MQINFNAHGAENQALQAFLYILFAQTCLVGMGHFIKLLSLEIDTLSVFVVVQVASIFLLFPVVAWRGLARLRTRHVFLHSARCTVGVAAMFLMFYAYEQLDLSLATLLKLLSPAFIPFAATLILGEKPNFLTIVALAIALLGVAVSLNIDLHEPAHVYGVIAATAAAMFAALGKSFVRRIGRNDGVDVIAFYFACFGALFSIPVWLLQGGRVANLVSLPSSTIGVLVLVAVLATLGQYTATVAFTKHRAAVVGLFTYLALPIAGIMGMLFWGEQLTGGFVIGSVLILLAGIVGSGARFLRSAQT